MDLEKKLEELKQRLHEAEMKEMEMKLKMESLEEKKKELAKQCEELGVKPEDLQKTLDELTQELVSLVEKTERLFAGEDIEEIKADKIESPRQVEMQTNDVEELSFNDLFDTEPTKHSSFSSLNLEDILF